MDSKQHLCNCYHILKVQMSKFNDKVSIRNVFTLIFAVVKTYLEKSWCLKTAISLIVATF
jgi:hypothetical protein